MFKQNARYDEVGKIRAQTDKMVMDAARLVKRGVIYDLGTERFAGMPNFPSHKYKVYSTSNPLAAYANPDPQKKYLHKSVNKVRLAFNNDDLHVSSHSGTHIDTLAHVTVGEDCHWYNGYKYGECVTESGVNKADASAFVPVFTRGVLLDIARLKGVDKLENGYGITERDLMDACRVQDVEPQKGDAILIHTGFADDYPQVDITTPARAGINELAAKWLIDKQVYAVGSDTESLEQMPSVHPENPYIVHTLLLVENGVYIIENLLLGQLASDKIYEFLFVALPLTNRGSTASMINPVAVI